MTVKWRIVLLLCSYTTLKTSEPKKIETDECRTAVNTEVIGTLGLGGINNEFRCMQQGRKQVYWGETADLMKLSPELEEYRKQHTTTLYYPSTPKYSTNTIRQNQNQHVVTYTTDGYKNGLLLAIHEYEERYLDLLACAKNMFTPKENVRYHALGIGSFYLVGYLLGYKEEDIRFLYQRNDFLSALNPDYSETKTFRNKGKYVLWTAEQKKQFQDFIATNTEWHNNFERDKKETHEWIARTEDLLNKEGSPEEVEKALVHYLTNVQGTFIPAPVPIEQSQLNLQVPPRNEPTVPLLVAPERPQKRLHEESPEEWEHYLRDTQSRSTLAPVPIEQPQPIAQAPPQANSTVPPLVTTPVEPPKQEIVSTTSPWWRRAAAATGVTALTGAAVYLYHKYVRQQPPR